MRYLVCLVVACLLVACGKGQPQPAEVVVSNIVVKRNGQVAGYFLGDSIDGSGYLLVPDVGILNVVWRTGVLNTEGAYFSSSTCTGTRYAGGTLKLINRIIRNFDGYFKVTSLAKATVQSSMGLDGSCGPIGGTSELGVLTPTTAPQDFSDLAPLQLVPN